MPARKDKTPTSRSVGAEGPAVQNPYAPPGPEVENPRGFVPAQTKPRVPVSKYIVPPAAPRPEVRAHGHVLTERGWVREERKNDDG